MVPAVSSIARQCFQCYHYEDAGLIISLMGLIISSSKRCRVVVMYLHVRYSHYTTVEYAVTRAGEPAIQRRSSSAAMLGGCRLGNRAAGTPPIFCAPPMMRRPTPRIATTLVIVHARPRRDIVARACT